MFGLKEEIDKQNEIDDNITEQNDCSIMTNLNINQVRTEMGFKTLVEGFDSMIFVIPKYQRKFVWTKEQVEELAISLLRGLPIPPIYVYRNINNQLEILDGQQRMLSLFLYYKGKYFKNLQKSNLELANIMTDPLLLDDHVTFEELLKEKSLLKDVKYEFQYIENTLDSGKEGIQGEKKIEEINYEKLDKIVKRKLDFTPITIIEINVGDSRFKNRILYTVFKNLNNGGSKLKNQEIRNGAYQSKFYDMIHDINNNNETWRVLFGDKHKHSKDVELLLRFAAVQRYFRLKENDEIILNNYNGSYTKMLNDFSDEAVNFNENEINKYEADINIFLNRFYNGVKLPHQLLESLYFASLNIKGEYKLTTEFCLELLNSEGYKNLVKAPNSAKTKVKERFEYVYKSLYEYVKLQICLLIN